MNCYDNNGKVINELTQWETGREVHVKNFTANKAYVAHVFNTYSKVSKVVSVSNASGELSFKIPVELLQVPYMITLIIFEKNASSRIAAGRIELPVQPSAMPEDYEYFEPESSYGNYWWN